MKGSRGHRRLHGKAEAVRAGPSVSWWGIWTLSNRQHRVLEGGFFSERVSRIDLCFREITSKKEQEALAAELGEPISYKSGVDCNRLRKRWAWSDKSKNKGQRGRDTASSSKGSSIFLSSTWGMSCPGRAAARVGWWPRKPWRGGTDPGGLVCSSPQLGSPGARLHRSFLKSLHAHLPRKGESQWW